MPGAEPMRRSVTRLALGAALVVAALPSGAQVNRCLNDSGRAVYGDQACESASFTRDAEASRRLSGVAIDRYPVHGTDADTLLADLRQRAPSGFHGFANWAVDYRYDFRPEGGRCRVIAVRTQVKGRVLMPQWVDEARAPQPLRDDWRRYEAALIVHEEGHIAHGQLLVRRCSASWAPSPRPPAARCARRPTTWRSAWSNRTRRWTAATTRAPSTG